MNDPDPRGAAVIGIADMDALLVRVGQKRDRAAFRAVFEFFAPRIRAFLRKRNQSSAQADDLTQDVMVLIWRRAETFDPERAAASTWIYTIARNALIDSIRRSARRSGIKAEDVVDQMPDVPMADELLVRDQNVARVSAALTALPQAQREILQLAYLDGQSHREISERLDLPLGTVKSRVRLAMNKLREMLGDD